MKKSVYLISFTVTGVGDFPVDMLRYDQCWPITTEDANAIQRSLRDDSREMGWNRWEVRLTMVTQARHVGPTKARWESFLCKVSNITETE